MFYVLYVFMIHIIKINRFYKESMILEECFNLTFLVLKELITWYVLAKILHIIVIMRKIILAW